jgi:FAD/FMN-containing dehydrogenase
MTLHDSVQDRGTGLAGEVLTPGQDGYDEAATTLFAVGTPEVVVRPRDAAGVAAALRHATRAGLTVSVRSGGHSMAGLSTHSDGMVIDLVRINHVEVADTASRRVRIGAGATWGAVAAVLQPHGLGLTAGDTRDVGVGGLTLGGGIGWMARRYGLTIDSLIGADLVTADGQLLHASADRHADLFWALRGGGGNFGVVVSFHFIAQPVTSVHFGAIGYHPGDLPRLIGGWRDLMRASDENLTTTIALTPPMFGHPASATLLWCCASPDGDAAARALGPFHRIGPVTSDEVRAMPYAEVLEDARRPGAVRIEFRNTLIPDLGDELIAAIEAFFGAHRAALTLRSLGGAVARVPADATAFAHRDTEVMLVASTFLPADATPEQAGDALARWAPLAAHGSGAYVNFLGSASDADVAAVYPPATYQRLAAVKRAYDPQNIFRRNHNIRPSQG